jgi:hypothetical protein
MLFKGRTSAAASDGMLLRTTGSAPSCVVNTVLRPASTQTGLQVSADSLAFLESELRITGPDSFEQNGTITIGDDCEHVLRFSTLGHGQFTRGAEPGTMSGTASCTVEGGGGQFAAARGVITSTFTLSNSGELSELHCGLIFLPR